MKTILYAALALMTLVPAGPARTDLPAGLVPVDARPLAHDLTLPALDGGTVQLGRLRAKVVLVNFWATWCAPCIEQLRILHKASEHLRGDGFEVLAVNVGEDAERIGSFLERFDDTFEFPILMTGDDAVLEPWRVRGLPATFVIDKQGGIAYSALGVEDFASDAVVSRLEQLIAESSLFDLLPPVDAAAANRTLDPRRVARGKSVYAMHCQACHGIDAVGTPDWMERDSEGRLPPPPLNGTAHAWHHDRDTLRRTILKGTGDLGGTMPAWAGVLTIDDVDSVIDWIISLWPDSIYAMWRERTGGP